MSNSMYLKTVAVVLMLFTNISKADFATPFTGINNKVGDISEAHGYVVALDPNTENCTHFLVIVMDDCMRHIVINATAKKNVVTQSLLGRPVIFKAKVIHRNENAQTKKMEIELEILSIQPLEEQKHPNQQTVPDPNSLPAGQRK
jgi:hypothetical protein